MRKAIDMRPQTKAVIKLIPNERYGISGIDILSINFNTPEPAMIGIDSIKEKRTAFIRFKPMKIPPEIVIPDRDIPGIRASA